ncbi:MAG TPA: hypothetical protein PKE23_12960, partial [Anaerolineales bacterium]|nr:hypothetical protein [Anaerolineales bacterium]
MQRHPDFAPVQSILIPFIHNGAGLHALDAARQFDADIILVGVVVVPEGQSLSTGAVEARALRRTLKIHGRDKSIISKNQVIVSHHPWEELSNLIQDENPDLLCLEFDSHL